jgi:1,4-dihydroxy-2-naphthoate octaprenyltransferase
VDTDRRAGKRTLAVRLGRDRTRKLYLCLVGGAYPVLTVGLTVAGGPEVALLALFSAPLAIPPARAVLSATDGPALNRALAQTGTLLGAFSVLLAAGLLIAS